VAGREFVHRPAAIILFGIPNGAGFVDLFVSKANVGCGSRILFWNSALIPTVAANFAPILCRVIFIG
jgi:hypothetical protein